MRILSARLETARIAPVRAVVLPVIPRSVAFMLAVVVAVAPAM
jgi:hypothetical protein